MNYSGVRTNIELFTPRDITSWHKSEKLLIFRKQNPGTVATMPLRKKRRVGW